jgi:hypothetical protein
MIAAPLIHCIVQVRLWNQSEDRVKIVYHPEFLSSTSAILPLEYNEVLQTIKSRTRTRTHVVVILIRYMLASVCSWLSFGRLPFILRAMGLYPCRGMYIVLVGLSHCWLTGLATS